MSTIKFLLYLKYNILLIIIVKMMKEHILLISSIYLCYMDIRCRRVPNPTIFITATLLLLSDIFFDPKLLFPSFSCSLFFFLIFNLIFFFKKGIGYGDVKYITLLAYVLPFYYVILSILIASLIALLFIIIFRSQQKELPFIPFLSIGLISSVYVMNLHHI